MSEWRTIQMDAGPARSPREAWIHATFSLCPGGCGNRPSSMGVLEPQPGFAYRLGMRCRHCRMFIQYDYHEGADWHRNQARHPLALASDSVTSQLAINQALEAMLEARHHWLSMPRPASHDQERFVEWQQITCNAARDSLEALLELAKLKRGHSVENAENLTEMQVLAALFVETGGDLPASLGYLLQEDRESFDVSGWLHLFFTDRELFNSTRLESLDAPIEELLRASVTGILENLVCHVDTANRYAKEIAILRADLLMGDQARNAASLLGYFGLHKSVHKLLHDMQNAVGEEQAIIQAWINSVSPKILDFFTDLGYYQRVLQQAISNYQQLTKKGCNVRNANLDLVSHGPYLDLLQCAYNKIPAWPPENEHPIGTATALEAANEAISCLLR